MTPKAFTKEWDEVMDRRDATARRYERKYPSWLTDIAAVVFGQLSWIRDLWKRTFTSS